MLQLRPGLSFCFIGDRAVLLDLEADRYFLLAGEPLRVVRDAMVGRIDGRRPLIYPQLGPRPILVEGAAGVAPVAIDMPTHSALEAPQRTGVQIGTAELFGAQFRSAAALRIVGLRHSLSRWRATRPSGLRGADDGAAAAVAQSYAAKRALVPLRRSCVPDSLALVRLLWRRGIDADVLFGVRLDPFAAHCWVQQGDQLLSDPLSNVTDFTPVFHL